MMLEEVLGKFVSHQMMVKDAKYIDDVANGRTPSNKPQAVAFKATKYKEVIVNKVAQVEAVGLNDKEMSLVINCFKSTLKGRKNYNAESKVKRTCLKCGRTSHFIANCPNNDDDQEQDKKGRRWKRRSFTRRRRTWRILARSGTQTIAPPTPTTRDSPPSPLTNHHSYPNKWHICLMAKEQKVYHRTSPNYTFSSDEESSDDEEDYSNLFKGLDRYKIDNIKELIDSLNEMDILLEKRISHL
jgi:hypothetical protein